MAANDSRKYNVLSLFAGAGGLDLGFEQTGRFETLAAIEYQPEFAETLRINQRSGYFPKMKVIEADIRSLDPHQIALACFPDGKVDVIMGGPPCETFSQLGKRAGRLDPRGLLSDCFAEWVSELLPRAFLMENVPQLMTGPNAKFFDDLCLRLGYSGYHVSREVLCAADYGSPTSRKRLITMGAYDGAPPFPEPTHGPSCLLSDLAPFVTVGDALQDLEPARFSPAFPEDDHVVCAHGDDVINRFSRLNPGERDHRRRRNRLRWDEPSLTLFAGTVKSIARHIHPDLPREITNRECARIHGFPDDFVFAGRMAAVCKQIANSVPVDFARALANALATFLDTSDTHEVTCG